MAASCHRTLSMAAASQQDIKVEFATDPSESEAALPWQQRLKRQLNPASHSVMEIVLALLVLVLFAIVIVLAAAGSQQQQQQQQCGSLGCLERAAYAVALANRSGDACADFFAFACGQYPPIKPLEPTALQRTVFTDLRQGNRDRIERILAQPPGNDTRSHRHKVRLFFSKCVDDFSAEKEAGLPLAILVATDFYVFNASNTDAFDINDALVKNYAALGAPTFFEYRLAPVPADGNRFAISIDTGGLGMAAYHYLRSDSVNQRIGYKRFVHAVGTELAKDYRITVDEPTSLRIRTLVDDVILVETELANISFTAASSRPQPADAEMPTLSEMETRYPPLKWTNFFRTLYPTKITASTRVVVQAPIYLSRVSEFLRAGGRLQARYPNEYKRILSNYMNWRTIQRYTGDMTSAYVHAQREFEAKMTTGTFVYESRLDYCFRRVQENMLKALSAAFVRGHLQTTAKAMVDDMYKLLQSDMIQAVNRIGWFPDAEQTAARAKLAALQDRLGYFDSEISDQYLDEYYGGLTIYESDFTLNIRISFLTVQRRREAETLGSAPDTTKWDGATYDTNLHLNNRLMRLTVPAGIMQWPLFYKGLPKYINYATLGSMIGAELVKAIDSSGQFYDQSGNMSPWWSVDTLVQYAARANCTRNYFAGMRAGPYVTDTGTVYHVNIRDIIDTNLRNLVAAIDGLRLAAAVYAGRFAGTEMPLPLTGFSNLQAFYLSWAQNFCYNRDPQFSFVRGRLLRQLPEEILVNGVLSQLPEFASAFGCSANSRMVQPRCHSLFYN